MKKNIFVRFADVVHSMPISQMGNYQEHLKTIPAQLREVESAPVRQHMFGNPFKIDKVSSLIEYYLLLPLHFYLF